MFVIHTKLHITALLLCQHFKQLLIFKIPTENKWQLLSLYRDHRDIKMLVTEFQLYLPTLNISMTHKCEKLYEKNSDHLKHKLTVSHKNVYNVFQKNIYVCWGTVTYQFLEKQMFLQISNRVYGNSFTTILNMLSFHSCKNTFYWIL